ncbi:phosphotransferase [Pseudoalteromonas pernae]|uniref:phosphotransferase n=1 Tax=Pseudoalteromonas pernae TaxID=3118054 RepID=UPI003242612E
MPESVARIREIVHAFNPDIHIEQITFLPQGVSNENYRVDTPNNTWLVKLYAKPLPNNAIAAQRALAALGTCPEPVHVDDAHRCAIFAYLPGAMPGEFDHQQAVQKLVQIHTFTRSGSKLDLHAELAGYEKEVFYRPYAEQLEQVVTQTHAKQQDWCFCHNDLIKENIISYRQQWCCIDFEYAQVGDRYFDLAMLTLSFKLAEQQQQLLFEHYFNEMNLEGDWQKFIAMQKLVAALNYFWYQRQGVHQRVDDAKAQLDALLG